jgi:lipoprotein-anchoring transpeptidase ErfK/SrfK
MRRTLAVALAALAVALGTGPSAHADETTPRVPAACTIATTICIDTTFLTLRYMREGRVVRTMDIRIGSSKHPTDLGLYRVYRKERHHRSTDYGTPMPYSLFYNGAESIHYSKSFRRDGYNGASYGCVNLRDYANAGWLFRNSPHGTRVYVY